jgi:hypothetical protein
METSRYPHQVHGLAAVLRRRWGLLASALFIAALLAVWLLQPAPVRRVVLNCWAFSWPPLIGLVPWSRYTQDLADPGQRDKVVGSFGCLGEPPSNALPALVAMLRDYSVSDRTKRGIAAMLTFQWAYGNQQQQWVRDTNATGALVDVASKVGSEAGGDAIAALSKVRAALLTQEDYRRLAELRDKEPDDVRGRYRRDEIDAILATNPYAPGRQPPAAR